MSKGLFQSGARNTPDPADARVSPVLWIRMLDTMYVKGDFTVLRVKAGAVLRVQRGRDDRDFDIPFDKALDLMTAEFAEEAEGPEEGAPSLGDAVDNPPLDALWDTVRTLQTALGQIAQLAEDPAIPPSKRLPAIAQIAASAARRQTGGVSPVTHRKGSWNGR